MQKTRNIEKFQVITTLLFLKAPAAYPYPDPYYRSIFAPYDAQPYPPQPYGGQPMVCFLTFYTIGLHFITKWNFAVC